MRKRLLAYLLALCMVLRMLPVTAFADDDASGGETNINQAEDNGAPGGGTEDDNTSGGGTGDDNTPGGETGDDNTPGGGTEDDNTPGGGSEDDNTPGGEAGNSTSGGEAGNDTTDNKNTEDNSSPEGDGSNTESSGADEKEPLKPISEFYVTSGDLTVYYNGEEQGLGELTTYEGDVVTLTYKLNGEGEEIAKPTLPGVYTIFAKVINGKTYSDELVEQKLRKYVIQKAPLYVQSLDIEFSPGGEAIKEGDTVTARLAGMTGSIEGHEPKWKYSWNNSAPSEDETYTVGEGDKKVTVKAIWDPNDGENQNYAPIIGTDLSNSFTVGTVPVTARATLKEGKEPITKAYDGTTDLPDGIDLNEVLELEFSPFDEATQKGQKLDGARIISGKYDDPSAGKNKALLLVVALADGDKEHSLTSNAVLAGGVSQITKAPASLAATEVTVAVGSEKTIKYSADHSKLYLEFEENGDYEIVGISWDSEGNLTFKGLKAGTVTITFKADATDNCEELPETAVKVTVTDSSSGGSDSGSTSGGSISGGGSSNDFSGGGSSGDFSGGGSGSSGSTTTTPSTSSGTTSTSVTPSVSGGSATATVSSSAAQALVSDAVKYNSSNVTVKVNAPSSGATVNSVTASVPASAVASLADSTNASLTVESSVANVTLPNSSLSALGGASGKVTVTAAKNGDESITVTVRKDGQAVGALSGGMKVSVPVSAAAVQTGSGLVAVLINSDGTQTILPKSSLDASGEMKVLLDSGSATVKFVDNSKSFVDTAGHWAGDAVDFVSSRNLFQGTSNNVFTPDQPMNRAMLVTVLHRLEREPGASRYSFADVPFDSYYAEAAAWALSMGITNGDGGSFNGEGQISREQLATMLYRYAQKTDGSLGAMGSYNWMGDSNQVHDWADAAMRWAVGSGIITGDNGNLRPGDSASRAEVATMLKRFVNVITK